MKNQDIADLALRSYFRRARAAAGIEVFDQPTGGAAGICVDRRRRRVTILNGYRVLARYTYRDDGHRVVFRVLSRQD